MTGITFERESPEESRIYCDWKYVGDVYRQEDIRNPGSHHYIVRLESDGLKPHRIRDRSHIRKEIERLVRELP